MRRGTRTEIPPARLCRRCSSPSQIQPGASTRSNGVCRSRRCPAIARTSQASQRGLRARPFPPGAYVVRSNSSQAGTPPRAGRIVRRTASARAIDHRQRQPPANHRRHAAHAFAHAANLECDRRHPIGHGRLLQSHVGVELRDEPVDRGPAEHLPRDFQQRPS